MTRSADNQTQKAQGLFGTPGSGPGPEAVPRISVCITTRDRHGPLDACLESLVNQIDAPSFELLVCCQGNQADAEIVRRRFPDATVGLVDNAYPGGARNFLVDRARGELLLFLDDDVTFTNDLLSNLIALADRNRETSVFGGPNLTPPGSTTFQSVQGAILGSIVATGPVRRRYGQHPGGRADERFFTLCNMAVRRNAMVPFPHGMSCAEENAVLATLASGKAPMLYDPNLAVYHERRPSYRQFARQMNKYGKGRGELIVRNPRSCRPAHLAPLGLLVWLLSLPLLARLWSRWWLLSLVAYGVALVAGGMAVANSMGHSSFVKRLAVIRLSACLTATVHFCYAVGVISGVVIRPPVPASKWEEIPVSNAVEPPGAASLSAPESPTLRR